MRPFRWWRPAVGLAVVVGLGAALAGPIARWAETPPSIQECAAAVRRGDYDGAELGLRRLLAHRPDHREANLLLTQVLIDRPNPRPAEALTRLAEAPTRDPRRKALAKVQEGKALYQLSRFVESEAAWVEARRLDPNVPEAGWLLIQQYYLQGRADEVSRLVLELHPLETDPRDRVRYLLEPVREEVDRLAAAGIIPWLRPAVDANPNDRRSAIALGRALAKEGRTEEGYPLLQNAVANAPDDIDAWDAWLGALADAGELETLREEIDRVPDAIAGSPRLAPYRGRIAQERRDFREAVAEYRKGLDERPCDPRILHRMTRALRLAGLEEEARAFEEREATVDAALKDQKSLHQEALGIKSLGLVPEPALYQRFAEVRERLGKPEEAACWHRLVLQSDPKNGPSLAALKRLEGARTALSVSGPGTTIAP